MLSNSTNCKYRVLAQVWATGLLLNTVSIPSFCQHIWQKNQCRNAGFIKLVWSVFFTYRRRWLKVVCSLWDSTTFVASNSRNTLLPAAFFDSYRDDTNPLHHFPPLYPGEPSQQLISQQEGGSWETMSSSCLSTKSIPWIQAKMKAFDTLTDMTPWSSNPFTQIHPPASHSASEIRPRNTSNSLYFLFPVFKKLLPECSVNLPWHSSSQAFSFPKSISTVKFIMPLSINTAKKCSTALTAHKPNKK